MAIKRITLSVPVDVARKIKKAARSRPVSEWVTEVIEERLTQEEASAFIEKFYADVAPTADDVARGKAKFDRMTRSPKRRPRRAA